MGKKIFAGKNFNLKKFVRTKRGGGGIQEQERDFGVDIRSPTWMGVFPDPFSIFLICLCGKFVEKNSGKHLEPSTLFGIDAHALFTTCYKV